MRSTLRVSPVSAACRLRWPTAGTDGAWPIQVSAAVRTHPDTTSVAQNALDSSLSGPPLPVGQSAHQLSAPQHALAAPTAHPKSP